MEDTTREEKLRKYEHNVKAACRFLVAVFGDEADEIGRQLFRKDRDGGWPSFQYMDVEPYSDAELVAFIREACLRWEKEKANPRDYDYWGIGKNETYGTPGWESGIWDR